MNRVELQHLAQVRIDDAAALLAAHQWPGAYYLAGYALECGLKSCILAHLERTGAIFKDREYLKKLSECWTHELVKLVEIAGLAASFGAAQGANPALRAFWGVAKDWKETSRYELKAQADAEGLYEAITHVPDGVLTWIRTVW